MKLERSNVDFLLWRKKVDRSLFDHKGTTIPRWAAEMWGLPGVFLDVSSKRDPRSTVSIRYESRTYRGWVTAAGKGRSSPAFRLWFEEELAVRLQNVFLMSYMRSLEQKLARDSDSDIENEIPFWEFLDIECSLQERQFSFTAYYTQKPSFPNLFERLIGSPGLKKVADRAEAKKARRIYKQDWKARDQLGYEIGATNVLYLIVDTKHRLIYVGEAKDLVARLSQRHPSIPEWDHYRYDVLPDELAEFRIELERMLIRSMAAILPSKRELPRIPIEDFKLTNDKIDK